MGVTEAYPPLPSPLLPLPPSPPSSFCSPGRSQAIVVVTGVRRAAACWRRTHSLSLFRPLSLSAKKPDWVSHFQPESSDLSRTNSPRRGELAQVLRKDARKEIFEEQLGLLAAGHPSSSHAIYFFLPRYVGSVFVLSVDLALQSRSGLCSQGFSRSGSCRACSGVLVFGFIRLSVGYTQQPKITTALKGGTAKLQMRISAFARLDRYKVWIPSGASHPCEGKPWGKRLVETHGDGWEFSLNFSLTLWQMYCSIVNNWNLFRQTFRKYLSTFYNALKVVRFTRTFIRTLLCFAAQRATL